MKNAIFDILLRRIRSLGSRFSGEAEFVNKLLVDFRNVRITVCFPPFFSDTAIQ